MLFGQFREQFNARLADIKSKATAIGQVGVPVSKHFVRVEDVESNFALLRQDLEKLERDVAEANAYRGPSCELSPKM